MRQSTQAALLVALICSSMGSAFAQATPPDAGSLSRDVTATPNLPRRSTAALPEETSRAAATLDNRVKIALQAIRLSGNKAFTDNELQPLVADAIGRELTLNELDVLAQRLTQYYRAAGYLLARAYLPAQEIKDGTVEIAVLEGRLGKLAVDNRSSLAQDRATGYLQNLREGEALRADDLEHGLLLLSDLPGVDVKSTLRPGASVGTTDLDIHLADKSPYAGGLELDNYGNRYIGDWRLGANLVAGNLAGLADTLAINVVTSEKMQYGRLAWQLPVGSAGTQLGAAWSEMHYTLGKDFSNLDAHGNARIGSLYLLHPFIRGRTINVNGQLAYDHKRLEDNIGSPAMQTGKTVDLLTAGLSGARVDGLLGGGVSNWSLAYTAGHLDLDTDSLTLDQAGHRTAGQYGKLRLAAARLQRLTDDWSVYASLSGQVASKNLDSSEKMPLGGAQGVRAYPQGEAPADDAWLANLELRRSLFDRWQASLFYDSAQGNLNHAPIAADSHNSRRLAGYGLGLNYSADNYAVQLTVAWRDGPQPTSDVDRSPRLWLRAVTHF